LDPEEDKTYGADCPRLHMADQITPPSCTSFRNKLLRAIMTNVTVSLDKIYYQKY